MATSRIRIDAPPGRVFGVLSDPRAYERWVVGARAIRDADEEFPERGSRLHHSVALGPVSLPDHTEVLDVEPPYRLELHARARPLGSAKVTLLVEPAGDGSRVTLIEEGGDPLSRLLVGPAVQPLLARRNDESLRRLRRLVEDDR